METRFILFEVRTEFLYIIYMNMSPQTLTRQHSEPVAVFGSTFLKAKQMILEMSSVFCLICGVIWGVWKPDNGARLAYDVRISAALRSVLQIAVIYLTNDGLVTRSTQNKPNRSLANPSRTRRHNNTRLGAIQGSTGRY
jgi:hypothetical protein